MKKLFFSEETTVQKNTRGVMLDLLVALLPACAVLALTRGFAFVISAAVCVICAVISELIFDLAAKKAQTVSDCTAAISGLLLALSLGGTASLLQCAIGSVFAAVVVKGLFGGYGKNIVNPSAAAHVFMLLAFSLPALTYQPHTDGAAYAVALIAGYIFLSLRGHIKWYVPPLCIASSFVFILIFTGSFDSSLAHVLSGSMILCSVFMATDPVTAPASATGRVIFSVGFGLIASLFSLGYIGSYPNGATVAILIMNLFVPLIDEITARGAHHE